MRSKILLKLIFASCVRYSDRAYYGLFVLIKDMYLAGYNLRNDQCQDRHLIVFDQSRQKKNCWLRGQHCAVCSSSYAAGSVHSSAESEYFEYSRSRKNVTMTFFEIIV